jgi:hypothetical protein
MEAVTTIMNSHLHAAAAGLVLFCAPCLVRGAEFLTYEGKAGPGLGKHIVFLAGDEEYRSEEGLPMLAKILAVRQGFKCTVLFSLNPADGTIDPMAVTNLPGLERLGQADLCVMKLRFRELPDEQMRHFVDYLESGKPLVRCAPARTPLPTAPTRAVPTPASIGAARNGPADSDSKSWGRLGESPRRPREGKHGAACSTPFPRPSDSARVKDIWADGRLHGQPFAQGRPGVGLGQVLAACNPRTAGGRPQE